jgi:triosephosphate isomerase
MHWASSGAFTGEISALMLRDLGVDLVMLGHAERRHKFGETDSQVNKKVRSAIHHHLRVLLCVGETAKQRQAGITDEVLAIQLKVALAGFPDERTDRLMVAYEPVWAIGAGSQEAQPQEIAPSIRHIKSILNDCLGEPAQRIPVLYGGSVTESNCSDYVQETDVDGLFVGRAAWQPEGFINVLRAATAR